MGKKEFEEAIANISNSFSVSKEKIGAHSVNWKLLPKALVVIAGKFDRGEPISDAEILEYKKVWRSDDPLIDENGRPFVFYIHDFANSHWGKPNRVFHVAWCQTLERMDNNGRKARYVKKSDLNNNDFTVDYGEGKKGIEHLPACINCRTKMEGLVAPSELYYQREGMDIAKFFSLYGRQDLLDISNPMYPVDYPANWNQISASLRERAGWKCSSCHKDFSANKSQLHVHHKDGRRGVVHVGNLEVVCADCHSKKFGHSHMRNGATRVTAPVTTQNTYRSPSNQTTRVTATPVVATKANVSSSQKNKFDSFIAHPERYATGSDKAKQKVLEVIQTYESMKGNLSQKEQGDFLQAIKTYKEALKGKV
jgi:hypothetical protein